MADIGGLSVHISGSDDPSAPILLLLHGLTDSGACWPDAVARWSHDYRIVAADALGHGTSRRFSSSELSHAPVPAMVEQTRVLAQELARGRTRPVIAVGHSMGGGVAAALAAEPGLLSGAVLEEPAWLDDDELDPSANAVEWLATTAAFDRDPGAALAAGRIENPRWPEVEFAPWALAKRQTDEAFLAVGQAVMPGPWSAVASCISVPSLVVTGTDDVILTDDKVRRLEALGNPLIRTAVIQGAGHCVRRDDSEGYHRVVDAWLRDLTVACRHTSTCSVN